MNSNNIHPQVESDEKSDLENQKYVEVKNNPWIQPRNRQIDEKTVEILENENPEAQKGLDLRWLVRTAQRKALLIIGITSLTTAAWYVNSRANPVYQGSFQLLVEPVTSAEKLSEPSTLTRTAGVPNERLFELDYPTIMQILTSPGMLSNIVKEIKLKESALNISAADIKQNLVLQRLGGERRFEQTKIINITYQGIDPKIVNLVLEVTAQRYLRYSLEERKSRIGQGVEFIEKQLPDLYKRVANLQKDLQNIQEKNQTINTAGKGESLFAKVREIEFQQLNTQRELQEFRNLKGNLEQQLNLNPDEAIVASTLTQDPNYQKLLAKLKEVESQIAIQTARFQANSPSVQSLQAQRQNLLTLLNQETEDILGKNLTEAKTQNASVLIVQNSIRMGMIQQLTDTANQIQLLKVRAQELAKDKSYFEQQAKVFPSVVRKYNEIQRELEIAQRSLNQLLTQRETLKIEAAQSQVPWEIISQPQIPINAFGNPMPIAAESHKQLLMGLVGGLFFSVVASVLIEKSRDIFYTIEDLEDVVKYPILGKITVETKSPKVIKSKVKSVNLIQSIENSTVQQGEYSRKIVPIIDAYNSLYSNLRFCFSDSPIRTLVVCTAEAGDDSTKIAFQLAQTAVASGERVLLVDTNFRNPQVHLHFDLSNSQGLSDLLSSQSDHPDLIQRPLSGKNLFVLTSGKYISNSARLLTSARMKELKAQFVKSFDLVIYNTPDILSSMEATFISTTVDATLMIATIRKTKKSLFTEAIEDLKQSNVPNFGIVANQVN
ncbi:hypothetical protein RintRC_5760 [Richelia intracellularis]|nr:hypothetical protein RintRC_5760 [Richelia intracellularis]